MMVKSGNHQSTFRACLDELPTICNAVTEAARMSGMDEKNIWKLEVALDEACTNIACYGYKDQNDGKIWMSWRCNNGNFEVQIEDEGVAFDQTQPTSPDFVSKACDRKPGGFGRYIIREFTDQLRYKRIRGRNVLTMVKKLACDCESSNSKECAIA